MFMPNIVPHIKLQSVYTLDINRVFASLFVSFSLQFFRE